MMSALHRRSPLFLSVSLAVSPEEKRRRQREREEEERFLEEVGGGGEGCGGRERWSEGEVDE